MKKAFVVLVCFFVLLRYTPVLATDKIQPTENDLIAQIKAKLFLCEKTITLKNTIKSDCNYALKLIDKAVSQKLELIYKVESYNVETTATNIKYTISYKDFKDKSFFFSDEQKIGEALYYSYLLNAKNPVIGFFTGSQAQTSTAVEKMKGAITSLNCESYIRYTYGGAKFQYNFYDKEQYNSSSAATFVEADFKKNETKEESDAVYKFVLNLIPKIITNEMTTEQKVYAINNYIALNTRYYEDDEKSHTAYSLIKNGYGVCQGYALLAYKMLDVAGINSIIVEGKADGEPHAWIIVKTNSGYMHFDPTYNDPIPDKNGRALNNYTLLTAEQIKNDHSYDESIYSKQNLDTYFNNIQSFKNPEITLQIGKSIVTANGIQIDISTQRAAQAKLIDDTTMLPIRKIAELLGCYIEWDSITKEVTIQNSVSCVKLKINSYSLEYNGEIKKLDTCPIIINDYTYMPLRAVAESLGKKVEWDKKTQTAIIN